MKHKVPVAYATALLNSSLKNDKLDLVYRDMRLLSKLFASNDALVSFIKTPAVLLSEKLRVINSALSNSIDNFSFVFISYVLKRGRQFYLSHIIEEFLSQYEYYKKIVKAKVYTVQPLSGKQNQKFKDIRIIWIYFL